MSFYVVNNIIVDAWTVLDLNSLPLTGVTSPAGVTLVLQRQSGAHMIAAAEAVTWTEVGATGRYDISFTPLNSGLYVLYGLETHASSMGRTFEFRWYVVTAGAVFSPSFTNAFCALSDIERWTQTGIDSTTQPNDTEAAAFAEARAAVLASLCAKWGFAVTPATVTAGSRLEDMLREANAIGAALDYTIAQQFARSPNLSDRAERLQLRWLEYVGNLESGLIGILETEVAGNLSSLATDHIISGDTLAFNEGAAPTAQPIGISMGSLF
jgi:hypothetical protein